LIEKLKYTIRKLRHERFGQSSERGTLLDQLELQLADLEADAAQAEAAAQIAATAASEKITVPSFERRRPARRPLPERLPRERIVYPAPSACPCCGGRTLRKIGKDVTETLELIPRQWKVIQHVREKFSCRACEAISQPPAPSHPIVRGRAGPNLQLFRRCWLARWCDSLFLLECFARLPEKDQTACCYMVAVGRVCRCNGGVYLVASFYSEV
jgi:transposase